MRNCDNIHSLGGKKYDEIQEAKKSIIFSMDKGISETQNNDVSEISIEPTLQKTRRKRNVVNSASKRKLEISEEVQEHSTKQEGNLNYECF